MRQSRLMSLVEAVANVAVGYGVAIGPVPPQSIILARCSAPGPMKMACSTEPSSG